MILNTLSAFAGPSRTTYQAKIIKPDGYPLESSTVNFKFTILDPAGSCILYSETFSSVNMGASAGLVSFSLGSGVRTFPVSGSTFEQVFSNTTASLTCDAGGPATYSPLATDTRKIVMQFNDGNGWQTLPAMTINAVPYAMYANDSLKFSGKDITDFVQVASLPTCGASEAIRYNGVGFSCIAAGGSGGSVTSSSVISALGYTPADGASITTVTSTVDSVSSTVASVSSTVYSVSSTLTSLQNSVAASFAAIANSQWLTSGTTISYNNGNVGIGTSTPITKLEVSGGIKISTETAACAVSYAGTLRYDSGNVEFCNGSTWAALGVAGAVTSSSVITALGYTPADNVNVTTLAASFTAMSSLGAGQFLVGNASSTASAVALSGDATLSDTGALTLANTGVAANTYGSSTLVPIFAVDSKGRITSASTVPMTSSQWTNVAAGPTSGTTITGTGFSPVGQQGTQSSVPTSGSVDDGYYAINLPFAVNFNGNSYSTIYVGTNSYVTFNGPSTLYAGLSAASPALDKILIDAADRSSNSVWFFSDANSFSIRYEGGCTTAPATSLVWELQGSNANVNQLKLQIISVCGGGFSTVANASTQLQSLAAVASTAYLINYGLVSSGTSDTIYFNGHVGIGTSSPTKRLDVVHDTSSTYGMRLKSTTPATIGGLLVENDTGDSALIQVGNSAASSPVAGHMLLQSGSKDIVFRAATNERLRILASGEVGIGTSTPFAKLDVSGGIRIGMESFACAVNYAGTLRYNAGDVQMCNGSTWQTLSTGSVTSAAVIAAMGYTPADSASVSSSITSLSSSVVTSFTTVNSSITSVSSSVTALLGAINSITPTQWETAANSGTAMTTLSISNFSPLGQLGAQNSTPTTGSVDDGYYTLNLPFAVTFNGTSYTTMYVGTNSYVTFGGPSTVYSGLSATNPALNKIVVNAADRSSNSVWFFSDANSFSIRYEGGCTTAPGTSLVWELQGSVVNTSQLKLQIISVCSGGFSTIASPSAQLQALNATAGTAYVIGNGTAASSIYFNGHVGVGTSSPMVRLDVAHDTSSTYGMRLKATTSATVGGLLVENDLGDNAVVQVGQSSASSTLAGHTFLQASKNLILSAANVERLRILSTGEVGIGTSTPYAKLDVSGGIRISMETNCAVSYAGTLRYNAGSLQLCNGSAWQSLSTGSVTSSTVATALASATNVGIGTNSPAATLDVSGTVKISGGSPGAGKVLTSDASGNATWQTIAGDNLGNHTATQNINLGNYKLVGQGGSEGITIDSLGNIRLGSVGGSTGITAGPGSTASGSSWASIAAGFNAQASSITSFAFGSYARATNWYAFATGNNTTAGGRASAVFGQNMTVNGDYSVGFGLSSSVSYTATTPSTMAIMGGNVGIGTTAPATSLHVRGGASYGAIMLGDNGGTTNHHLTHELDGSFAIFTGTFGSGVRQLTITSGGAVGIGTTTPVSLLEVSSASQTYARITTTANNTAAELAFTNSGATDWVIGADGPNRNMINNGGFHFWKSGYGTAMLLDDNGYVGIGTVSPTATLHVNGTARIVDGNQAAARVLASDASGNASWKQTIIHGTVASVGNTSTTTGQRVSSGVYITLPPGRWQITGMGITTGASCRADFGVRVQATDSVVKYTLMPVATGDFQTATVTAYVDIASTTTYDLYISSRGVCNSQVHSDNMLWDITATGVAY